MARYNQNRKRSRSSAGRSNVKRRRTFKRRPARRSRIGAYSSTTGAISTINMRRGRKMNSGMYRRALLRATQFEAKYTVTNTTSSTLSTPANLTEMTYLPLICLPGLSSQSNWFSSYGGNPTTITGPITVRGGIEKFTLATEAEETIACKVFLIWVKAAGSAPGAGALAKGIDPVRGSSDITDQTQRVMKCWAFNLERSSAVTLTRYVKPKQYDAISFGNGYDCMYWYVAVGNTVTGSAVACTYVIEYNVSVTADVDS